ncbi:MAG: hypothetical protein GTO08_08585, partial [Deltaproteobacteria bacterium]|nr:hypothetical protein [Deltaproteobacteria bacterium]
SLLAKELGAEVLLLFSTPVRDGTILLHAKLFWSENAVPFAELEEPVPADVVRELVQQERLDSLGEVEQEPWGSYRIEYGELIAMGDVDGDKEQELVVSDGNTIQIYTSTTEPRGLGQFKDDPNRHHLHVDVMDVNRNGRAEIFVTSLVNVALSADIPDSEMQRKKTNARVVSSVFEYDQSAGYRKIQDNIPYAMRIIDGTLLLQKFTRNKTFTGPVVKGGWNDGRYLPGDAIQLPEGLNIYGFTYVDWENSGEKHILSFDDSGQLALFSGTE